MIEALQEIKVDDHHGVTSMKTKICIIIIIIIVVIKGGGSRCDFFEE